MKPVLAVFANPRVAHQAVEELVESGIERDNISLLVSDHQAPHQFELKVGHKGAEAIAWGMTIGVLIGGLLGTFAAFAASPTHPIGTSPTLTIIIAAILAMSLGGAFGGAIGVTKPKIEAELRYGGHPDVDVNTALLGVRVSTEDEVRNAQAALSRLGGAVRS
jgi:hypothetical protein